MTHPPLPASKRLRSGWCVHGHPASHVRTHGPIRTHHGANGGCRGNGEIGVAAWRLATGNLHSTTSHTGGTSRGDAGGTPRGDPGGTPRGDAGGTTGGDTGDTSSTQTDVRACHLVEVVHHHVLSVFVFTSLSWLNVESQSRA